MSDEQKIETAPQADPLPPEPEPAPEPAAGGAERLRAFEDEHVGEDAPRQNGQIEKGHGSLFKRLPAEHQAHHAALEALVVAEADHQHATAAMQEADEKLEAAIEKCAATEEVLPELEPAPE